MKLNQPTNLRVEDYADQAKWIGRLFTVLNAFFTSANQVFDQNIDYATNIRSVTREFDSTSLTLPLKFAWPHAAFPPIELRVCKASADGVAAVLLPAWQYNSSTSEISIDSMFRATATGVAATAVGTRYKFTVRATI